MSCSLCKRLSSTDIPGESYFCRSCGNVGAKATPRARGQLEITDDTGKLDATIMGQVAEEFYKCSASDLMIYSKSEKPQQIRLQTQDPYIFYLKRIPVNTRESTYKFEIIALEPCQPEAAEKNQEIPGPSNPKDLSSGKRTQLHDSTDERSTRRTPKVAKE